jgi:disulfide bond formation protein DsbB
MQQTLPRSTFLFSLSLSPLSISLSLYLSLSLSLFLSVFVRLRIINIGNEAGTERTRWVGWAHPSRVVRCNFFLSQPFYSYCGHHVVTTWSHEGAHCNEKPSAIFDLLVHPPFGPNAAVILLHR